MEQLGKVGFTGQYDFELWRDGVMLDTWSEKNLIPTEGLNNILGVSLHADAQNVAWYMGIGSGNYTVDPTDAAVNIATRTTEIITYSGNRPQVVFAVPVFGSITNAANKVTFTFNAPIATITNAFVMSTSTGSAGVILSSLKLVTAKTGFASGDQLVVAFTMTAASV